MAGLSWPKFHCLTLAGTGIFRFICRRSLSAFASLDLLSSSAGRRGGSAMVFFEDDIGDLASSASCGHCGGDGVREDDTHAARAG